MKAFDRLSTGVLIGAITSFSLSAYFDADVAEQARKNWVQLASIVAAMVAAIVTLSGVRRQINNSNELDEKRRLASLRASKSMLPLALMQLTKIAECGISLALRDDGFYQSSANAIELEGKLEIGDRAIGIIRECMEYSDEETQRWIAVILAYYQIALSRHVDSVEDESRVVIDQTKAEHAADWAIVRGVVSHLYTYSRSSDLTSPGRLSFDLICIPLWLPNLHTGLGRLALQHTSSRREQFGDGNVCYFERELTKDLMPGGV